PSVDHGGSGESAPARAGRLRVVTGFSPRPELLTCATKVPSTGFLWQTVATGRIRGDLGPMTRLRALPVKIRIYRVPAYEPPDDDERPPAWPAPDPWQPTLDFTAARSGCPRPSSGRGVGPVRSAPAAAPVGEET